MVVATGMVKSFDCEDLHFQSLIRELSREPYYPSSLHIRNHLIAPYSVGPASSLQPQHLSQEDPWQVYKAYRKGVQLLAVGDVPSSILRGTTEATTKEGGRWAIAIVYPYYVPGWQVQQGGESSLARTFTSDSRFSLWLSSESASPLVTSSDDVQVADEEDEALLAFLFQAFVPQSIRRLDAASASRRGECGFEGSVGEPVGVDLFAVNAAWVQVMQRWTREEKHDFKLTRASSYMTFLRSEAESDTALPGPIPSRWQVGTIESAEDVLLVQAANEIAFPQWYIDNRKHISVFLRDGQGQGEKAGDREQTVYPSHVHTGAPVAWAFAHDNLSIASLHVAKPYRRMAVGSLLVNLIAAKLIEGQKQALAHAGCPSPLPTPCFLHTSMEGTARHLFAKEGFKPTVLATWGTFTVAQS